MKILLSASIILLAASIVIDTESPKDVNPLPLIVKVDSNKLLTGILQTYGILLAMNTAKPQEAIVDADTPEVDQISIGSKESQEWSFKGRKYYMIRNKAQTGSLGIGVFRDPNEALRAYLDTYFRTSVIPVDTLDKELGDRSARWPDEHHRGCRRILFLRDNVVVDVYLESLDKFIAIGGEANATMEIAKAIDSALVQGILGVQRGKAVKVPRIVAVYTPEEVASGSKVAAKVRIAIPENPQDPNSKDIEIMRTFSFYAPAISTNGESEEKRTFMYEVTYISSGCVVASRQMTIRVRPRASRR